MQDWEMTYQKVSDKELAKLGTEINSLIPEAQQALLVVLKQRKIEIQPKDIIIYERDVTWKELQNQVKFPDIPRQQILAQLQAGTRIIVFQYCFSYFYFSHKRNSPAFFVKFGETLWNRGMKYSLFSLFLGWWGVPWGPVWTISTIYRNFNGGIDITERVRRAIGETM